MNENHEQRTPDAPPTQGGPPQKTPNSAIDNLIPGKNMYALMAYYFGVFSLVPCLGLPLSIVAIVLGFLGLNAIKKDQSLPGKGHAITGIVLGSVTGIAWAGGIIYVVINARQ